MIGFSSTSVTTGPIARQKSWSVCREPTPKPRQNQPSRRKRAQDTERRVAFRIGHVIPNTDHRAIGLFLGVISLVGRWWIVTYWVLNAQIFSILSGPTGAVVIMALVHHAHWRMIGHLPGKPPKSWLRTSGIWVLCGKNLYNWKKKSPAKILDLVKGLDRFLKADVLKPNQPSTADVSSQDKKCRRRCRSFLVQKCWDVTIFVPFFWGDPIFGKTNMWLFQQVMEVNVGPTNRFWV